LYEFEFGDEELRGVVGGTLGGPHQIFSVWGEDGEDVGAFFVGDSGFLAAVVAHQIQLIVGVAVGAGGVDEVLSVGMPIGAPVNVGVVGELVLLGCAGDLAA